MSIKAPPGWTHRGEQEGLPIWQHQITTLWVVTDDLDLLRCVTAALLTFRYPALTG